MKSPLIIHCKTKRSISDANCRIGIGCAVCCVDNHNRQYTNRIAQWRQISSTFDSPTGEHTTHCDTARFVEYIRASRALVLCFLPRTRVTRLSSTSAPTVCQAAPCAGSGAAPPSHNITQHHTTSHNITQRTTARVLDRGQPFSSLPAAGFPPTRRLTTRLAATTSRS